VTRALPWLLGALTALPGCAYVAAAITRQVLASEEDDAPPPANTNAVPSANVTTPSGNQYQSVALGYLLIDPEGDPATVAVSYEFSQNGGATWSAPAPATERVGAPSEGVSGLATSPVGAAHVFVWNAFADVGGVNGLARLTVLPSDPGPPPRPGTPATTAGTGFPVLNRLIATVAGGGSGVLGFPGHVIADASGNCFIADTFNHRVQVLNGQGTPLTVAGVTIAAGQLGVIAGTGTAGFNGDNQMATQTQFNFPSALALDGGGHVLVADSLNHRVRRVDRITGFVTTLAGTGTQGTAGDNALATLAQLDTPRGVAVDPNGNVLVADTGSHALRVLNTQSTTITYPPAGGVSVAPNVLRTFAGTLGTPGALGDGGGATNAALATPWGIAMDATGHCYVADAANHAVRCINLAASGSITIAGVAIAAGDIDTVAGRIGMQGFAGDGASANSGAVRLDTPRGIALDGSGNLLLVDTANARVRCVNTQGTAITRAGVTIASGDIATIAGGGASPGTNDGDGGAAVAARLQAPEGCAALAGNHVAVADTGLGRIRVVNVGTGSLVVAGVTIGAGAIDTVAGTVAAGAQILRPAGVVRAGNLLFVADGDAHTVWQVDLTTGATTAFAGTGQPGTNGDGGAANLARLSAPAGLALDGNGNLYVIHAGNGGQSDRVRVVNRQASTGSFHGVSIAPGNIDTVAAGSGPTAFVDAPGIAVDGSGLLYIAHRGGHRVLRVDGSGTITTALGGTQGFVDGSLASARLDAPHGVAADGGGNLLVADTGNHALRYANLGGTSVTVCGVVVGATSVATIAGAGPSGGPLQGFNGDNQAGTATLLDAPTHAIRDVSGHVLFVDRGNERIRRVDQSTALVSTPCGTGTAGWNGDGIPPVNAHLQGPRFLFLDQATVPNCFFADAGNRRVRRFTP
jgi:sugar lactone lactonase YvrE